MSKDKTTETIIFKVEISLDEERQAVQKEKDYNRINSVALAIQDFSYSAAHIKDINNGEVFWAGRGLEVSWYLADDSPRTEERMVSELFNYVQQYTYGERLHMINHLAAIQSKVVQRIFELPKQTGE